MHDESITNNDPIALFQNNIKLTRYFVHKRFPGTEYGTYLYEELLGEARIGLWKAALTYDPEKGKFTSYAGICICGCIIKYYSRKYKKQAALFESSLDFIPDGFKCTLGEIIESDLDTESTALKNVAEETANNIVKEKYKYLNLYYLQGLSQQAISKALGISQVHVSRSIKRELNLIKRELKLA